MLGPGGKRFAVGVAVCASAILAVGAALADQTGSRGHVGVVKLKLPHSGDFSLAEVTFRTKAKVGTLRLLNQSELASSVLIFGGVAKLKGSAGTFVAFLALVNRKTARAAAGAAQGDEADLQAGGEVQSTNVEQNILEAGAGAEPFPGPPSESDLLGRMSPGIYTKSTWPSEITKRPITLAKGMLEIARDVRAGREPDATLIRRLIDVQYRLTPRFTFGCEFHTLPTPNPIFPNHESVEFGNCMVAFTQAALTTMQGGIAKFSHAAVIGPGVFLDVPGQQDAANKIHFDFNPAVAPGQVVDFAANGDGVQIGKPFALDISGSGKTEHIVMNFAG